MPSMISEADDSSWKFIACNICDGKFDNEQDVAYHKERVHDYGETCCMYSCEECGFQGTDRVSLNHMFKLTTLNHCMVPGENRI